MDITLLFNRRLRGFKRLMGNQEQSVRIIYQCIAGNSGLFLIGFGKSTVDNHQLAVAFDRTLSVLTFDRYMSVNNMWLFRVQSELPHDGINHILIFQQLIIWIFRFHMRLLLCQKMSLKGSHTVFAEQWWIRTQPDIPHDILAVLPIRLIQCKKTFTYITLKCIVQRFSFKCFAKQRHFFQRSVHIERYTAMI